MAESSAPADDTLTFKGVLHVGKAGVGTFKLTAQQFGWVCTEAGKPNNSDQFGGSDILCAEWQKACAPGRALVKIYFKNGGGVARFTGFRQEDMGRLKTHLHKHFGVDLTEKAIATEGWSWGDWSLEGDCEFQLMMNGKLGLEVPISELSQVSVMGKTDLNLQFQDSGSAAAEDEVLHDLRFFVPGEGDLSAEQLCEELQQRTGSLGSGEVLEQVPDVMLVAPRGKHDFAFFKESLKVHGKSQSYTVKYSNIARLFMLELLEQHEVSLVIALNQPLRQGQQSHELIVLIFDEAKMMVPTMPENLLEELQLQPQGSSHAVFKVAASLMKKLSGQSIISPTKQFGTGGKSGKEVCFKCNHKSSPGFLFPFKKALLFVKKPAIYIRYDQIENAEFQHGGQMRRASFDLVLQRKGLPAIEFSQVAKDSLEALSTGLKEMGVDIVNQVETTGQIAAQKRRGPEVEAGTRPRRSAASTSTSSRKQQAEDEGGDDGPEDEEDDDDYDEEGDEGSVPSSEGEMSYEEEEEDKPAKKRAKKGR